MAAPTRFTCSLGHSWEPTAAGEAPLVCPNCGRPPTARGAIDPEMTLDQDPDRTIDVPSPVPGKPPSSSRADTAAPPHATPAPRSGSRAEQGASSPSTGSATPMAMPFTIVRQHARGGLGVINLARDEHIRREVALKQILPQHCDNPTLQKRFLYEAQITGQLEHPSIVPVYTLGTDEMGNPYYVMRFVRGRTLDTIIIEHHASPNPIVLRELLRRFIAVCQALAYAHSRGVIHRDLKPSNIMLGDYGETLVLDWGLAKDIKNKTDPAHLGESSVAGPVTVIAGKMAAVSNSGVKDASGVKNPSSAGMSGISELTMAGQIVGTPAYMAPEQADGRADLHGPVTDIYALGGILYKILTGQSPHAPTPSHDSPPGQQKLTFVESPPPSTVNKDVHPELEQVCVRAMAREPAVRYPRALEMAQDIQRWLDEHPLHMRRETGMAKVMGTVKRFSPLIIAGLLAVIAALVAWVLLH